MGGAGGPQTKWGWRGRGPVCHDIFRRFSSSPPLDLYREGTRKCPRKWLFSELNPLTKDATRVRMRVLRKCFGHI